MRRPKVCVLIVGNFEPDIDLRVEVQGRPRFYYEFRRTDADGTPTEVIRPRMSRKETCSTFFLNFVSSFLLPSGFCGRTRGEKGIYFSVIKCTTISKVVYSQTQKRNPFAVCWLRCVATRFEGREIESRQSTGA